VIGTFGFFQEGVDSKVSFRMWERS